MADPTYVSLFSGAGGFDIGFDRAGFRCVAQVEIDRTARDVLARHWPGVPRFPDVRGFGREQVPRCDVLVGGFPCQDLSVAGKRAGLGGERSGLFYELARIADELRPSYVVWENVPGLRSSGDGRDFLRVLVELDRLGFDGVWGTLDARHYGVPQSRERVFGVFARRDLGVGGVAEVLALAPGMRRDTAAGGEAGQVAPAVAGGGAEAAGGFRCYGGGDRRGERGGNAALTCPTGTQRLDFESETFVVFNPQAAGKQTTLGARSDGLTGALGTGQVPGICGPLLAHSGSAGYRVGADEAAAGHIVAVPVHAVTAGDATPKGRTDGLAYCLEARTGRGHGQGQAVAYQCHGSNVGPMGTLRAGNGNEAGGVPFVLADGSGRLKGQNGAGVPHAGPAYTLDATGLQAVCVTVPVTHTLTAEGHDASEDGTGRGTPIVVDPTGYVVRRLTPRECERLMGWPDDWTRWRADGREIKDGPRYRLCGNGVVATKALWIARRLRRFGRFA